MRLFVAIDIDPGIREKIARFVEGVAPKAPDARWVSADTYHITLTFIGEFEPGRLSEMKQALSTVTATPIDIAFRGCGFFSPRNPKAFWIGIHAGEGLAMLAAAVEGATARVGIPPEGRDYTPHLTLARTGSGRPQGSPRDRNKPAMWALRDFVQRMPPPDFGTMTAREFYLYESKLGPGGAKYTKIERFEFRN